MATTSQQLIQATNNNRLSRWCWFWRCYFILQLALMCPMLCILHELSLSTSSLVQINPSATLFVCRIDTPSVNNPTAEQTWDNALRRQPLVALFAMVLIGLSLLLQVRPQTQSVYQQYLGFASFDMLPKLPPPRSA